MARSFFAILLSYTLALLLAGTVAVGATDQAHRDRLLDVAFPHVHVGGRIIPLGTVQEQNQPVFSDHSQGPSAWPGAGALGATVLGGEALAAATALAPLAATSTEVKWSADAAPSESMAAAPPVPPPIGA